MGFIRSRRGGWGLWVAGEGGGGHTVVLTPSGLFPSLWSLEGRSQPQWDRVYLNKNTSGSRRVETGWVEGGEVDC